MVQCATVTSAADYELRVVTRDIPRLHSSAKILSLGTVSNIETGSSSQR